MVPVQNNRKIHVLLWFQGKNDQETMLCSVQIRSASGVAWLIGWQTNLPRGGESRSRSRSAINPPPPAPTWPFEAEDEVQTSPPKKSSD